MSTAVGGSSSSSSSSPRFAENALRALRAFMKTDHDGVRWLPAVLFMRWICDEEQMEDLQMRRDLCQVAVSVFREEHENRPPFAVLLHRPEVPKGGMETDTVSTVTLDNIHTSSIPLHSSGVVVQPATATTTTTTAVPIATLSPGVTLPISTEVVAVGVTAAPEARQKVVVPPTSPASIVAAPAASASPAPAPGASGSPKLETLLNLHGFLYFLRALKSITTGYTTIDQLYVCGAAFGRTLFSPSMKELEACLTLPPRPPVPTTTSPPVTTSPPMRAAAAVVPGHVSVVAMTTPATPRQPTHTSTLKPAQAQPRMVTTKLDSFFAPSLPPRRPQQQQPSPSSTSKSTSSGVARYHPFERPPGCPPLHGAAFSSSSSMSGGSSNRTPLQLYRARVGHAKYEEAFRCILPPLVRRLQETPLDMSGRLATLQADNNLAHNILCQLPNFLNSVGQHISDQRTAARELLSDLHLNTTLVPALRCGRISCTDLMTMDRTTHIT